LGSKAFSKKYFRFARKIAARTSDMITENSSSHQIAEGTKMSPESPGQGQ
jgi:hypothetical protein